MDILNDWTPNVPNMNDSASNDDKHNTDNEALDTSPLTTRGRDLDSVFAYAESQLNEKDRLKAEAFNASFNYDMNAWNVSRTLRTDPRSKWLVEYQKTKDNRHKSAPLSRELSSALAENIMNGNQAKYSDELRELRKLNADASKYSMDDPFFETIKHEMLSNKYYEALTNEKIPADFLYQLQTNEKYRSMDQEDFDKAVGLMLEQDTNYKDLYDNGAWRLTGFNLNESAIFRGGALARRKDEINTLIRDPEKSKDLLKDRAALVGLLNEQYFMQRVMEDAHWYSMPLDAISEGLYSQFATADHISSDELKVNPFTAPEPTGGFAENMFAMEYNRVANIHAGGLANRRILEAQGKYDLVSGATPQFLMKALQDNEDMSVMADELINSDWGQSYIWGTAAASWGTMFVGGPMAKGAVLGAKSAGRLSTTGIKYAFRYKNLAGLRVAKEVVPKAIEKKVASAAGDAAGNAALQLANAIKNRAVENTMYTATGIGGNFLALQTLEGVKQAAIQDVLNMHGENKSVKDAFYNGLTDNMLGNLSMVALFASPQIAINTTQLIHSNQVHSKLTQSQNVVNTLATMKSNDEVLRQVANDAAHAGDLPQTLYFAKSDVVRVLNDAVEDGNTKLAEETQAFMSKYESTLTDIDEDVATYELSIGDIAVSFRESSELRAALNDKMRGSIGGETSTEAMSNLIDNVIKTVVDKAISDPKYFNTTLKNMRVQNEAKDRVVDAIFNDVYTQLRDIQAPALKSKQGARDVELLARSYANFVHSMTEALGISSDEFINKYKLNFKRLDSKYDITDKSNTQELGAFDPNSFTIYIGNDAGFYTVAHETIHTMIEILMREEDTLKARATDEAKQSILAINAIRRNFPELEGKKWADLTPKEQELIHETIVGDYIYRLQGDVAKYSVVDDEGLNTLKGVFDKGVTADMRRIYAADVATARELMAEKDAGIVKNSNAEQSALAAITQNAYADTVQNTYGIDVRNEKHETSLKMVRDWMDVMYREAGAEEMLNNVTGRTEVEQTLDAVAKITQQESFPTLSADVLRTWVDKTRDGLGYIASQFKSSLATAAPLLQKYADSMMDNIGSSTQGFGNVKNLKRGEDGRVTGSGEVSPERADYNARKEALMTSTGLTKAHNDLEAARKLRTEAIAAEKEGKNKHIAEIQRIKDEIDSLSEEYKNLSSEKVSEIRRIKNEITKKISAKKAERKETKAAIRAATKAEDTKKLAKLEKKLAEQDKAIAELEKTKKDEHKTYNSVHGKGALSKYNANMSKIKSKIESRKRNHQGWVEKNKAENARLAEEHKSASEMVKELEESIANIKKENATALKALEREDELLTKNELRNIRSNKLAAEQYANAQKKADDLFKEFSKQLDDPESELNQDYTTLLAQLRVLNDVQIDEASLLKAMSPVMGDLAARELVSKMRKRGWVNSTGKAAKAADGTDKEILSFETYAARVADSDAIQTVELLRQLGDFTGDKDGYARSLVESSGIEELSGGNFNKNLQDAEIKTFDFLAGKFHELTRACQKMIWGKDSAIGRGAAITNLAKFKQHEVGKQRYNKSSPHRYLQAARICMREGAKYMSDLGSLEKAIALFAHAEDLMAKAREATRMRHAIDKAWDDVRRTLKRPPKERYKSYDPDIMMMYELLAERAGLVDGKASYYRFSPEERTAYLARFEERMLGELATHADNPEVYHNLVAAIKDPRIVGNANSMQLGDLSVLMSTLTSLKKMAAEVSTATKNMEAETRKGIQTTMLNLTAQRIGEKAKYQREFDKNVQGMSESKSSMGAFDRLKRSFQCAMNGLQKIEFVCEKIDKSTNGFMKKHIYTPIREAQDKLNVKSNEIYGRMESIYGRINELTKNMNFTGDLKLSVNALVDGRPETMPGVATINNGRDLFAFILNMGAPDNREALARQFGYSDPRLADAVCKELLIKLEEKGLVNADIMAEAQKMWDIFRELHELTVGVHQRVTKTRYKTVEGQTIKFSFGEYKGGYVPLSIDSRMVEPINADSLAATMGQTADPLNSFTKERTKSSNTKYDFSPNALLRRTRDQLHYAYMAEPVIAADNLLGTTVEIEAAGGAMVKASVKDRLDIMDNTYTDIFKPWLLDVGTGGANRLQTPDGKIINYVANQASTMVMALNAVNAFMNLANFALASVRIGPSVIARGALMYATGRHFNGKSGAPTFMQDIANRSEFMNHRMQGIKNSYDRAMRKAASDGVILDKVSMVNEASYIMQTVIQNRIDAVIWAGSYDTALKRISREHPNMGPEELARQAVREADQAVRTTQGSMELVDSSGTERAGRMGPLMKIIMPYSNFFIHQRNLLTAQWKLNAAEKKMHTRAFKQAWLVMMGFVANGMFSEYLRMIANGDAGYNSEKDTGDQLEMASWATVKGGVSMFHPLAGIFTSYGIDKMRGEYTGNGMFSSPALSWGDGLVNVVEKSYKAFRDEDEFSDKDIVELGKVLGLGMPVLYNGTKYGTTIYNVAADNYNDTDAADTARALIFGKPSHDMKD